MLRWRLLLGAVLIAALVGLCWLDSTQALGAPRGLWLFFLALVASLLASGELLWLFAGRGLRPSAGALYLGNFLIVASNGVPLFWLESTDGSQDRLGWPMMAFAAALIGTFLVEMARYRAAGESTERLSLAVLAYAYVGLLLSFLVQLRAIQPVPGTDDGEPAALMGGSGAIDWGMVALGSMIAIVKAGDIGAYTIGRMFGRHKMAPLLSPGKTWEGAIGAIGFGVLAAWLIGRWIVAERWNPNLGQPIRWILLGSILAAAGLIGDLAESLLKRDLGRKDSSSWMPGFGGVLDLLDSLLVAAPVAFLCWSAGLAP